MSEKEEALNFLQMRFEDQEQMLREFDLQIDTRLTESKRRLEDIRSKIDDLKYALQRIPSSDAGIVNSIRSRYFSAIQSLDREYRNERIQALKDVSQLRLKRQELAAQIETRRRLFASAE